MTTVGETAPKSDRRGTHPNSLANLKRPWRPGETGNAGKPHVGPMITPAMRRFAGMSVDQVRKLSEHPESLSMAEAIAIVVLIDALTTGGFSTGAKSRDQVLRRLDGDSTQDINIDKAIINIVRSTPELGVGS